MFATDDTIVAISTPSGRGGLGVVRLSGPSAVFVAESLTDRDHSLLARHATLKRVFDDEDDVSARSVVDEVIVTWFAAPHSYTGEDVVEISGHGSPVILERIVELCIKRGARLAEPGEFTLRAYLNGRLDLVQAEAVADLINAVTPAQARVAIDQLEGTLTTAIHQVDAVLFDLIAKCEASLDFPEEGFHFVQPDEIQASLATISNQLLALLQTASRGRLIREGRLVVIAGRPNTGKSSLFNALLGRGRAIVTEIPGTTRDLLSERVEMSGVPVTLVDTAGIRASIDPVELEGVRRAHTARQSAELTLVVLDGSSPLIDVDRQLLADTQHAPRVIVINKQDCPQVWSPQSAEWGEDVVRTSASTGVGLDQLRARIVHEMLETPIERDTPTITNIRQVALVEGASAAIDRARAALDMGATEELLLIDLHEARERLEEVTGRRGAEDVLRHIFSTFCIGK